MTKGQLLPEWLRNESQTPIREEMLQSCCPFCTRLRADHPDLLDDVIVIPSILVSAPSSERRYRNGTARIIGCPHVREVFGPWPSEYEAKIALEDHLDKLRAMKVAHDAHLDYLLMRAEQEGKCAS